MTAQESGIGSEGIAIKVSEYTEIRLTKVNKRRTLRSMETKRLNLARIEEAMRVHGLNAAAVASSLGVSRTIVTEWLKGRKCPRARNLLDLGKLLELPHSDIVLEASPVEPIIAFRKHGNAKLRPEDEDRARAMGRAAALLVPYFPFGRLNSPARLINPSISAPYIEEAAAETRASIRAIDMEIRFQDIIGLFSSLKTVLVPVLWGEKESLDNALHIYLPDSQTSLVYVNLDTKLFDFKYWMLHELAHIKTIGAFSGKESEVFADAFAAAVLVPKALAESEGNRIRRLTAMGSKLSSLLKLAETLIVSPITLAKRIDEESIQNGNGEVIGKAIFGATTNFNKKYRLVSEILLGEANPDAKSLISVSTTVFGSPIYSAIHAYIADHAPSEGIISACLGVGPADAKAILNAFRNQ